MRDLAGGRRGVGAWSGGAVTRLSETRETVFSAIASALKLEFARRRGAEVDLMFEEPLIGMYSGAVAAIEVSEGDMVGVNGFWRFGTRISE